MLDCNRRLFRWGPIGASPLFMYYTIPTSFAPLKRLFGECYSESIIIFRDNKVTWFLDSENFSKAGENFVRKNIFSTRRKRYIALWDEKTRKLAEEFRLLDGISLRLLGNEDLVKAFKKFSDGYMDWFSVTMSVELITETIEPRIREIIEDPL